MYPLVGEETGSVVLHQRPQVVRCAEEFLHLAAVAFKVLRQHVPAARQQEKQQQNGNVSPLDSHAEQYQLEIHDGS